MKTKITTLLGIESPVVQGGMAWVAESHLAAAVSNAGGLGIIGAASAPAEWVRAQIQEVKRRTDKPFGVNIMLISPYAKEVAELVAEEKVPVVTTGAGSPEKYMSLWKEAGSGWSCAEQMHWWQKAQKQAGISARIRPWCWYLR